MYFTDDIRGDLAKWVYKKRNIKGMDELYRQITTDGKVNPCAGDGLFFQVQVAKQIEKSKMYRITEVEEKGSFSSVSYDNDIVFDDHICVQVWLGENMFVYGIMKAIESSSGRPQINAMPTDWSKDRDVWRKKTYQPGKPHIESLGLVESPNLVKILVAAPRMHFPLLSLPEWRHLLKDRVVIELQADFDKTKNLRGTATLHRLSKQHDEISMGIINGLGFRYVKSFNNVDSALFSRLDGLPVGPWRTSYLHTASQRIWLRPKVMTSSINADIVDGWFIDENGYEPPPGFGQEMVANWLKDRVGSVVWASMEQQKPNACDILCNQNNFESVDKVIANQGLAKNSQNGLYNAYDDQLDRNKTDKFDATVVYANYSSLELRQIDDLLDEIWDKSGREPDYFRGDPMALLQMLAIGHAAGRCGETTVPCNDSMAIVSAFDGIPVDFGFTSSVHYALGCIYAVSLKDDRGAQTGLRLMALSSHKITARPRSVPKYYVAFAVGEAVVDPRACGKIVHIRV